MLKIYPRISFIFIILIMTLIVFGVNVKVFAQATTVPTLTQCTNNPTQKTVCPAGGGCDYTSVQTALNAASAGWTINVKNGTYNELITQSGKSGTSSLPICLRAATDESPVLSGTGLGSFKNGIFILNGNWWAINGLTIRNYSAVGIKLKGTNHLISNNHVSFTGQAGLQPQGTSNQIMIENNTITRTGVTADVAPAIYLDGKADCTAALRNVTIKKNALSNNSAAIFSNNSGCPTSVATGPVLVENNVITQNFHALTIFKSATNWTYRNNTAVLNTLPFAIDQTFASVLNFNGTNTEITNIAITNNIFIMGLSTGSGVTPYAVTDGKTHSTFTVNYNLWKVNEDRWSWNNVTRTDFKAQYKTVTGWDANSPANPSFGNTEPTFVSSTDFHLDTGSLAIDAGNNATCATEDADGTARSGDCDIGAYDFASATPVVFFEVERAYFVDAANKPCTDTTPADGVCDADDEINKLTEIEKGSTEKLCIKSEDSEDKLTTILYAVLDNVTTPEGNLTGTPATLVAHIESALRGNVNTELASPNNLGCYADDSSSGFFCGGSATVFGTNGGWDGSHEVYTISGVSTKRWDCIGVALPDDFNDTPALAEAKIWAVLYASSSDTKSALLEEEGFDVITTGTPPGLPTASLVVKVGSVNNAVNFVRSDSLTFTGTWTGTNETITYQHCYQAATKQEACPTSGNWTCNASVPVTDTGADNTEDLAVSNFQTGMNRIELRIVDDVLQVATDTAFVCLQPTHKLKIGGQGTGAVK